MKPKTGKQEKEQKINTKFSEDDQGTLEKYRTENSGKKRTVKKKFNLNRASAMEE